MPWQGEHPATGTVNQEQLLNFDLEGEHAARDSDQYDSYYMSSIITQKVKSHTFSF